MAVATASAAQAADWQRLAEAQSSLEYNLAQRERASGKLAGRGLSHVLSHTGACQYCLGKSTRADVISEPEPMCAIFLEKTIGIHCRLVSTAKSSSCPTMPTRMHRQPSAVCAAGDSAGSKAGQEAEMPCCIGISKTGHGTEWREAAALQLRVFTFASTSLTLDCWGDNQTNQVSFWLASLLEG
eukprot:scaffold6652_cov62-Phaeocystis_antarctica.AAC.1